ncbi:MAG: hypothetical protein LLF95_05610 [Bacteroidales bacterium]|nr:hypothetical protein [Bacteroidales bacterium]
MILQKDLTNHAKKHIIQADNNKKTRNKHGKFSHSEIITILIYFHLGERNLGHYDLFYISQHLNKEFPQLLSYNRFVELQQQVNSTWKSTCFAGGGLFL